MNLFFFLRKDNDYETLPTSILAYMNNISKINITLHVKIHVFRHFVSYLHIVILVMDVQLPLLYLIWGEV